MYETLTINGNNLASYVTCIQSLDGLYNMGTPRGDNVVFPGVDGETWVDKPFSTGVIELGLYLRGSTVADFNQMLRALRTVASVGNRVEMRRRLSYQTGNEEQFTYGEFAGGLQPTLSFQRFGRVTMSMKVLDGLWYDDFTRNISVPNGATVTAAGETRTHRMTLSMPANSTISNATNGHTVSNTAAGAGTVSIDVETMVATQDGVDVSHTLSWNKRFPMRLDPGSNYFSGATGTIVYRAAYL